MKNYVIKKRSGYRIVCKYQHENKISGQDLFNKLNNDDFLVCHKYGSSFKEHNHNNQISKTENLKIERLKRKIKTVNNIKRKIPAFAFCRLEMVLCYNGKTYMARVYGNIFDICGVPSIQLGTEIIEKLTDKISSDVGIKIDIKQIKARHLVLNFEINHTFDTYILNKIKDHIALQSKDKRINKINIDPVTNRLSIDTDLGKFYIFKRGIILFASSKNQNENEVIDYINNLLEDIYKCNDNCFECKNNDIKIMPAMSITEDNGDNEDNEDNEDNKYDNYNYDNYVPNVVFI